MTPGRRREIHDAMVRFADGERDAFRAVFDGLWPVLLAFARGMHLDEVDAEDAAQRALLKVFDRIADLDRARDGVTWALTVTAYEVLTIRKQRVRRREESGDLPVHLAAGTDPEEALIAEDLRRALRAVVGELEERDRAALAEVLEETGITPGETARKRRFRAMERLRAAWRRVHG